MRLVDYVVAHELGHVVRGDSGHSDRPWSGERPAADRRRSVVALDRAHNRGGVRAHVELAWRSLAAGAASVGRIGDSNPPDTTGQAV
jgi:hypothetical protein